ncbi:hypothetical protein PAXRUDRAFT_833347 [Paxillus rubicundulus Ve08.2h10]|uniref:Unplaced genomic scaffold scaffold_1123, whole genome shotgun sequence n=1 Tax=Paxillus rubicundulus Ve08.2h10 TaxID=930991 RepID=A0A0D0DPB8_9AGAM|nr:hypothetical protein PAXRUDRAFT_833347 [Paxillus rubicundulus Ve08.2h10]
MTFTSFKCYYWLDQAISTDLQPHVPQPHVPQHHNVLQVVTFLVASTFPVVHTKSADGLPRPIHHLRYLNLALPEDDECGLHDYLTRVTIQLHATFDFKKTEDFLRYVRLADGSTQKMIGIRNPEINVTSVASHPPEGELVAMLNAVTTVMLKRVLPEVSTQWFPEGCWTPVSLPGGQQHDTMVTTHATSHAKSAPLLSTSSPKEFSSTSYVDHQVSTGLHSPNRVVHLHTLPCPSDSLPSTRLSHSPALTEVQKIISSQPGYSGEAIQASTRLSTGSKIVPAFEELKLALMEHHLLRGILREIHDCVRQLPGFEKTEWSSVLDENFVDQLTKSAVLKVMHAFCGGIAVV